MDFTATFLLSSYRAACTRCETNDTEDAERNMQEAWIEWRDYAEENGLCQQCGDSSPDYAICDHCIPYGKDN